MWLQIIGWLGACGFLYVLGAIVASGIAQVDERNEAARELAREHNRRYGDADPEV